MSWIYFKGFCSRKESPMFRSAFLAVVVGFVTFGESFLHCNEHAYGQLFRLRGPRARRAARLQAHSSQNGWMSPATDGWVRANLRHSFSNGVGLGLTAVDEDLGKAKAGYDVAKATHQFFNSGTPGNPLKAMSAVVGVDSIVYGPLNQAGVGPQAGFITEFAETATDFAMGKHDEANAAFKSGIARQRLDMYKITGDPKHLARAAVASRPDLTYGQLKSWDTGKPLVVRTHPGMPGQDPNSATGDLARSWKTTVHKEPFKKHATNPIQLFKDWTSWKLNPNNISINSSFDRTFHGSDGATRVQIRQQQTGYGYQPGQTRRHTQIRTEFRGSRTFGSGGGGQSRWTNSARSGFSRPSVSRPSFSRPAISRPSTSFR